MTGSPPTVLTAVCYPRWRGSSLTEVSFQDLCPVGGGGGSPLLQPLEPLFRDLGGKRGKVSGTASRGGSLVFSRACREWELRQGEGGTLPLSLRRCYAGDGMCLAIALVPSAGNVQHLFPNTLC